MSLRQLPTRQIVSGSTRAIRSATSPPHSEGARANFLGRETNCWTCFADDGAYFGRDLGASNQEPLVFVAYVIEISFASGAVA